MQLRAFVTLCINDDRWMGHITVWIITAHGACEVGYMAMEASAGGER